MSEGACKLLEGGIVTPGFAASTPFSLEFTPAAGILESLRFELRGSHTAGMGPDVQTDGEFNFVGLVTVEIPRLNRSAYRSTFFLKDLKWINAHQIGQIPRPTVPSASGANVGEVELQFGPGRRKPQFGWLWGIDTEEISGPIKVTGSWGVSTDYGAAQTMDRAELRVDYCVSQKRTARGLEEPRMAFVCQANRIALDSETIVIGQRISAANAELLYALLVRTDDSSALTNRRRDGLLTRLAIHHSEHDRLLNVLYVHLKRQGMAFTGLDADQEGLGWYEFNHDGSAEGSLEVKGKTISIDLDSQTAVPDGVTNVVNGPGDAVFVTTVGAQLSDTLAQASGA